MSDDTSRAVLVLTAGKSIEVKQSVEEIGSLIADSPRGDMSFFRVVDLRGKQHWVNVREIVEYHEAFG